MKWIVYAGLAAAVLLPARAKEQTGALLKPITVQEVLAERRKVEAECLEEARVASVGKPEQLGKNFDDCLDRDAIERVQEFDQMYGDNRDK
jgi:hypothetical protein